MIKGIVAALLAAFILAGFIFVILHFAGVILWLASMIVIGVVVVAVLVFVLLVVIGIIVFFAFFYYVATKKPTVEPGNYTLEEEKRKEDKP
jgi:predicted RND superfamily exporter protein